jgi:phenylacetate-CoA ligase
MPNPADTDFFIPVPSTVHKERLKKQFGAGKNALVYMGRVSYEKDIDQAIMAFGIALKELSDATLMIVGDGPERKKLEAMARSLGCKDKIIFTGMLHGEDLRNALWANDVFLTASRSENMPISIIEAMACGLPIASVNERGIPDIVHHGENGLLAPPGEPKLLARAIVELFSSPDDLRKKGDSSRKFAEQYSKKNVARSMIELYESVIENHKKNKH